MSLGAAGALDIVEMLWPCLAGLGVDAVEAAAKSITRPSHTGVVATPARRGESRNPSSRSDKPVITGSVASRTLAPTLPERLPYDGKFPNLQRFQRDEGNP